MILDELINGLAWSVFGLVLGLIACGYFREYVQNHGPMAMVATGNGGGTPGPPAMKAAAPRRKWGNRLHGIPRWVGVAIVLLALASVAEGYYTNHRAQETNRRALFAACDAGNQGRAAQIQLWDYVLSQTKPTTPGDRARIEGFRAYVHKAFAPRNCQEEINR
jgi:hypothetical protein